MEYCWSISAVILVVVLFAVFSIRDARRDARLLMMLKNPRKFQERIIEISKRHGDHPGQGRSILLEHSEYKLAQTHAIMEAEGKSVEFEHQGDVYSLWYCPKLDGFDTRAHILRPVDAADKPSN